MPKTPTAMTDSAAGTIDVQDFIDGHPLSRVQKLLLALCFAVVALDGFDVAIVGHIAPSLRAEWKLDVAHLGPLFAAGLFGLMVGAFLVGPLADRVGRKTMLVWSVVCFGATSASSALATDLTSLNWFRFVTGLGLGGAMPTAITLTSEYCPRAKRSSLVTIMFCGFTIGSALGGIVAAQIVTGYGWRPLFVIGGVAPLVLVPVLAWVLPESARYLATRTDGQTRIRSTLARIAAGDNLDRIVFASAKTEQTSPVRTLFAPEFVRGTWLLWLAFFMSLLVVYLLSNWMPTLVQRSGLSLRGASLITASFQIGGTVGAIVLGWLMDRSEPHRVLGVSYGAGAAFVILMGLTAGTPWLMTLAVFGAGFCVSGSQVGANALTAAFYPTACRTTGVSWALGVGRSGSIVGSLVGGAMLTQGWSLGTVYAIVAIPVFVASVAVVSLGRIRRRAPKVFRGSD